MDSWQEEMIPLTRGLINDIDDTNYTYTDMQITKFLIYAAHLNLTEITFTNDYSIDISKLYISPDPTTLGTVDRPFINFTCMKAALLILSGELKTATSKAVLVSDGPSSMDYREVYKAKKQLYDSMLNAFNKAKIYAALGELSAGVAILTPYTQNVICDSYDRTFNFIG